MDPLQEFRSLIEQKRIQDTQFFHLLDTRKFSSYDSLAKSVLQIGGTNDIVMRMIRRSKKFIDKELLQYIAKNDNRDLAKDINSICSDFLKTVNSLELDGHANFFFVTLYNVGDTVKYPHIITSICRSLFHSVIDFINVGHRFEFNDKFTFIFLLENYKSWSKNELFLFFDYINSRFTRHRFFHQYLVKVVQSVISEIPECLFYILPSCFNRDRSIIKKFENQLSVQLKNDSSSLFFHFVTVMRMFPVNLNNIFNDVSLFGLHPVVDHIVNCNSKPPAKGVTFSFIVDLIPDNPELAFKIFTSHSVIFSFPIDPSIYNLRGWIQHFGIKYLLDNIGSYIHIVPRCVFLPLLYSARKDDPNLGDLVAIQHDTDLIPILDKPTVYQHVNHTQMTRLFLKIFICEYSSSINLDDPFVIGAYQIIRLHKKDPRFITCFTTIEQKMIVNSITLKFINIFAYFIIHYPLYLPSPLFLSKLRTIFEHIDSDAYMNYSYLANVLFIHHAAQNISLFVKNLDISVLSCLIPKHVNLTEKSKTEIVTDVFFDYQMKFKRRLHILKKFQSNIKFDTVLLKYHEKSDSIDAFLIMLYFRHKYFLNDREATLHILSEILANLQITSSKLTRVNLIRIILYQGNADFLLRSRDPELDYEWTLLVEKILALTLHFHDHLTVFSIESREFLQMINVHQKSVINCDDIMDFLKNQTSSTLLKTFYQVQYGKFVIQDDLPFDPVLQKNLIIIGFELFSRNTLQHILQCGPSWMIFDHPITVSSRKNLNLFNRNFFPINNQIQVYNEECVVSFEPFMSRDIIVCTTCRNAVLLCMIYNFNHNQFNIKHCPICRNNNWVLKDFETITKSIPDPISI